MTKLQLDQISWLEKCTHHVRKAGDYLPAVFFFSGFIWDALTIGRNVNGLDLLIFAVYLLLAALILFFIARPIPLENNTNKLVVLFRKHYAPRFPYFVLQFLFGSLFSALFILYFKSSSHWLAWLMSLGLGVLLVANEFLESQYKRFTLSWAMFGLCAMLLFNFALPFLIGSIHAVWFYLSTLMGAALAYWLYKNTPQHFGSIQPVGWLAGLLMLAYLVDMIPPVPLVKREVTVAYTIDKVGRDYLLTQQAAEWWRFWRASSDALKLLPGQRAYCFSSVFAPAGLKTRLYHRWEHYEQKQGWKTQSRIGFDVSGGRNDGFRGYTYKQNLTVGDWRVRVETENEKTITVYRFSVAQANVAPVTVLRHY
ncbi:MAG: DUF2914 domain-containing protein [Betaproteobacteria bacterium HGW-Betaproteobacteria-22]|nr:MAG: DUF2914 domain-containing protein [Betaproteobacteria bacterium HGW-Betaproteobacteria-22]